MLSRDHRNLHLSRLDSGYRRCRSQAQGNGYLHLNHRRNAFTLVELVVVIMILGILAGIAAPKLLNTSKTATDNGLRQTLSIVRDAIELYAAENSGNLPPCANATSSLQDALQLYIRGSFPVCPVKCGACFAPRSSQGWWLPWGRVRGTLLAPESSARRVFRNRPWR